MARKKKTGDYFIETIELPRGPDGKRRRKYVRAKTAAGLQAKIQTAYAQLDAGDLPIRARDGYTVGAWLDLWLKRATTRAKLAPATITRYSGDIENHLKPVIGRVRLDALTVGHVQRMIDGTQRSPRTIRNILSPLIDALDQAVTQELVKRNVARLVERPELQPPTLYQLTAAELRAFLAAVHGDRFEALYWLATLGPREAELLALRWQDVDLDRGTITIAGGMRRLKRGADPSTIERTDTKTPAGRRVLRVPSEWVTMLEAHKAAQDIERETTRWREHGLVFPSTVGTYQEPQNLIQRSFKPALTKAGLPADKIRFHDLRHAAASMFIALGYDARTVADILGHSSPDFTLRQYAYAFAEVKDRAVADVGALLIDGRLLELGAKKESTK